jgi:hypothetical protein
VCAQPLLLMLGNFLLLSKSQCSAAQYTQLSEQLVQSYYSTDAELAHIAENAAYILVRLFQSPLYQMCLFVTRGPDCLPCRCPRLRRTARAPSLSFARVSSRDRKSLHA